MTAHAAILVVDDEAGIRDLLAEALRRDGYYVETAETAVLALARMDAAPFQAVICDWWLPDLHGLMVVDEAADRGAVTFLMSGFDLKLIGTAATRHRMLWKPLDLAALLEAVREALREAVSSD